MANEKATRSADAIDRHAALLHFPEVIHARRQGECNFLHRGGAAVPVVLGANGERHEIRGASASTSAENAGSELQSRSAVRSVSLCRRRILSAMRRTVAGVTCAKCSGISPILATRMPRSDELAIAAFEERDLLGARGQSATRFGIGFLRIDCMNVLANTPAARGARAANVRKFSRRGFGERQPRHIFGPIVGLHADALGRAPDQLFGITRAFQIFCDRLVPDGGSDRRKFGKQWLYHLPSGTSTISNKCAEGMIGARLGVNEEDRGSARARPGRRIDDLESAALHRIEC